MIGPGIVKVRLTVITPPGAVAGVRYAVQVGAFEDRSNAERLETKLKGRYARCRLVRRENASPPWRVLVGEKTTAAGADALAEELRKEFGPAFVVRLDDVAANDL
jgi:cell division protein FtsN